MQNTTRQGEVKMGCNIHGYMEILTENGWYALKNLSSERDYDTYGILFGVRVYIDIPPVVETRGFPEDAYYKTKREYEAWEGDAHSPSWMNVKDLLAYDWDQTGMDNRISEIDKYTGKEKGKASYTHLQDRPEECEKRGVYLKHLERRAGDLLSNTWQEYIEEMKKLAEKYGEEGVRVVVWFDN